MRTMLLPALLLLTHPALAEDDEFELDWDSIDLDGSAPQLVDYTGSSTQAESGFGPTARTTISLPVGNLKLRCSDGDVVRGSISYKLRGDDKDAMQRYGDGIRMSVWGAGDNGGVKVLMPSQPSGVKEVSVDLNVVVPKGATVVATANKGWVEAIGCSGMVTVSAGRDGAFAKGPMAGFKVSAGSGDVAVELTDDAALTKSSAITASKGKATLVMGLAHSARLDARGSALTVSHEVAGTLTDTSASGEIGAGGPSLVIRASDAVEIRSE